MTDDDPPSLRSYGARGEMTNDEDDRIRDEMPSFGFSVLGGKVRRNRPIAKVGARGWLRQGLEEFRVVRPKPLGFKPIG